jgi:hypothetical protein
MGRLENIWPPSARRQSGTVHLLLPIVGDDALTADPQLRLDQFRRIEPGQLTETLMISSRSGAQSTSPSRSN